MAPIRTLRSNEVQNSNINIVSINKDNQLSSGNCRHLPAAWKTQVKMHVKNCTTKLRRNPDGTYTMSFLLMQSVSHLRASKFRSIAMLVQQDKRFLEDKVLTISPIRVRVSATQSYGTGTKSKKPRKLLHSLSGPKKSRQNNHKATSCVQCVF